MTLQMHQYDTTDGGCRFTLVSPDTFAEQFTTWLRTHSAFDWRDFEWVYTDPYKYALRDRRLLSGLEVDLTVELRHGNECLIVGLVAHQDHGQSTIVLAKTFSEPTLWAYTKALTQFIDL